MHSEKSDEWFSHVPSEEITVGGEGQKKKSQTGAGPGDQRVGFGV